MADFNLTIIYNLETLLKTKIQEIHWKTDALDKLSADLHKNRQSLFEERVLLDGERRRVKELQLLLDSLKERIEYLEKDKQKYQQEKIALQINCDTALKERDSLLNQAQIVKTENLQLFSKIQYLEEKVLKEEIFIGAVKSTQEQLKDEVTKVTHDLKGEILKLKQEQNYCRESMNVVNKLHQRLVVMGMCAHIQNRDQNETIKNLQTKLGEISMKDIEKKNEMEKFQFSEMQIILDDVNESDSDDDLDKQVEAFIRELQDANDED